MGALSGLEPLKVFKFFEDICSIPHGSKNMDGISNYMEKFAKDRKLKCIKDKFHNVIIFKEASKGYENEPAVILQGHMDMVAVKDENSNINLETDPLAVKTDGDIIYAEGTSLGGDDGIALAMILAVLDDDSVKHPPIEAVMTADEEIGLIGASNMDVSMLNGRRLINVDSEEEGILITGCAGGLRTQCMIPVTFVNKSGRAVKLTVTGLLGGHSGMEINKGRGNSNCILARVLSSLYSKVDFALSDISGGDKDNSIPKNSYAELIVKRDDMELLRQVVINEEESLRHELQFTDKDIRIDINDLGNAEKRVLEDASLRKIITFVNMLPNGVQAMSSSIPGLVETSCSVASIRLLDEAVKVRISLRSSVTSSKTALRDKIISFTDYMGGYTETEGDYPPWEYRAESPLRDKFLKIYKEMYGRDMKLEALHAGLECGYLSDKIKDLDCVSIGPDMRHVHTTDETLSISSVQRVWKYLLRVLEIKE